jgi:hypothetical protein
MGSARSARFPLDMRLVHVHTTTKKVDYYCFAGFISRISMIIILLTRGKIKTCTKIVQPFFILLCRSSFPGQARLTYASSASLIVILCWIKAVFPSMA